MHLRSLTLKGFKSFPDRTRLEFGPGVSVVVGPNGSGKSNITDAVLWALGEQSPLAVRGQSMQDVIFSGARGQQARRFAEVELVIDNAGPDARAEGAAGEFSEISILRRLDRTGDGEYRLNGARCRLVDVLEVLSDTGLGKEMHSVVSQGRVESVVSSKPADRRLLVEEAAGLGKHRKRRRRAQLKLARTQDNLDRALDVEREARSRLRPLKRQAEAAELHERLERQATESRWELARESVRARRAALADAEGAAAATRGARDEVERALQAVAERREAAETALTARGEQREALSGRRYAARSAREGMLLRLEQARAIAGAMEGRLEANRRALGEAGSDSQPDETGGDARLAALEAELGELERDRRARLEEQVAELEERRARAADEVARLAAAVAGREGERAAADERAEQARALRAQRHAQFEEAGRALAQRRGELAAVERFLAARSPAPGGARALADEIEVEPGYERALAAALGGRLSAAVVADRAGAERLLDAAGPDGGWALVAGAAAPRGEAGVVPAPGAERLAERVRGDGRAATLARTLLAGAWVVEDLSGLPASFDGIAVTRAGRAWSPAAGEARQAPAGGEDRVLAERNRRRELAAAAGEATGVERAAAEAAAHAGEAVTAAEAGRDAADGALRAARREHDEAVEREARLAWAVAQRRDAPDEGPAGAHRAQVEAAIATERRLLEQAERDRRARAARVAALRAQVERDEALGPAAARLLEALATALAAVEARETVLEGELASERAAGEDLAGRLRALAHEEAELQGTLRRNAEAVTSAEVSAQQVRDQAAEAHAELAALAEALGLEAAPAENELPEEDREALRARIERLARRREQLGPVNPLAGQEYQEALEHVEELEAQRGDLETALRELEGLLAETDRRIRESFEETFDATARNFEELVAQLFPGGRGRLRLVREDDGPRRVLGGQAMEDGAGDEDRAAEAEEAGDPADEDDRLGVEIEMTPAGKSMKRLSLLSGGEKSLTALAFLFAIFLARPCPFYVLDEVEAALDDLNIDRFLRLLRRYASRAQFIVVTHQKRTMEAADTLYGVSMGDDGISRVISRRLPQEAGGPAAVDAA